MTDGHKHRMVRMKEDGWPLRLLRRPLLTTRNLKWVDRSRLVFGKHECPHENCYYLSLLGILHGLTGLCAVTYDSRDD